jgi:hypothetical protein
MKLALLALAALAPATAFAEDPAPYVVHDGRAAAPAQSNTPARTPSSFGSTAIHPRIVSGTASGAPAAGAPASGASGSNVRTFRSTHSSRRRGIMGAAPAGGAGGTPAAPASSAPPPYAVPGAKIITQGQQPVYSTPSGGGTQSVQGGGFIAIDQSRANDVGRGPGISWGPPDKPPSTGNSGGGGSGATSNGPVAGGAASAAPGTAANTNRGAQGATGFDPAF